MYRVFSLGLVKATSRLGVPAKCRPSTRGFHKSLALCISGNDDGSNSSDRKQLGPDDLVPDDFFDDEEEKKQELMDLTYAMDVGEKFDNNLEKMISTGLENLTTTKQQQTMQEAIDARDASEKSKEKFPWTKGFDREEVEDPVSEEEGFQEYDMEIHPRVTRPIEMDIKEHGSHLARHLANPNKKEQGMNMLFDHYMLDTEDLNTTMPRAHAMPKEEKEFMDNFKLPTSSERHAHHQPGNRHCEGKKQRRGKNGDLNCHLIDLDTLSPFDVTLLRRFITIDSEIVPRYQTGLCAKCQRKVAKCIKQSRNLGILPHLSEFVVKDQAPWKDDAFHTTAGKGKTTTRSGEGSDGREDIFVSKTAAV